MPYLCYFTQMMIDASYPQTCAFLVNSDGQNLFLHFGLLKVISPYFCKVLVNFSPDIIPECVVKIELQGRYIQIFFVTVIFQTNKLFRLILIHKYKVADDILRYLA